jgi:hypothetical protein
MENPAAAVHPGLVAMTEEKALQGDGAMLLPIGGRAGRHFFLCAVG